MQTCSIKWNYSGNYTVVFLYKSNSRKKHNWHCIIGFLINAALLNFYFLLRYFIFFRKEMYFFEWLYFSEYDFQISLYVFRLRKGPLIKYIRNCWETVWFNVDIYLTLIFTEFVWYYCYCYCYLVLLLLQFFN